MKNVAIGTITYSPSHSLLCRLQEALKAGYDIYIFDNSPENAITRSFVKENTNYLKQISYFTSGKNVGLGFGLSTICAHAYYDSYPALIFFDQDTVFNNDTLQFIRDFYDRNTDLDRAYSAIVFNSKNIDTLDSFDVPVKDVQLAINSGSLYFLKNLKKMNWHNIKYFVDCVDYEFCLSSNNFGFKIGEYTKTPGFDHSSEQADKRYQILGREYPMRVYSFSRIWDSIFATFKLLAKTIATGNLLFFYEISKAILKYIIVQCYVRVMNVAQFFKITASN